MSIMGIRVKKKTKKVTKKATRKKKSQIKIVNMDDVYRLLNKVQMSKKEVVFCVNPANAIITENVIQDLGLTYDIKELKTKTNFKVYPNDEDLGEEQEIDTEFLQDELPENGYIF